MSSSVVINIGWTTRATNTNAIPLGTYSGSPTVNYTQTYQSNQVTLLYAGSRSVAGSETLDVTSGLEDPYREALTFTVVNGIHVYNTGNGTLVIGGGSNPVMGTDQATVKSGKSWAIDGSFAVSGTALNLRVTGTSTYSIIIYGN